MERFEGTHKLSVVARYPTDGTSACPSPSLESDKWNSPESTMRQRYPASWCSSWQQCSAIHTLFRLSEREVWSQLVGDRRLVLALYAWNSILFFSKCLMWLLYIPMKTLCFDWTDLGLCHFAVPLFMNKRCHRPWHGSRYSRLYIQIFFASRCTFSKRCPDHSLNGCRPVSFRSPKHASRHFCFRKGVGLQLLSFQLLHTTQEYFSISMFSLSLN